MGIASELAGAVILIFLTLAFYRLFVAVDRTLATLVVILGGVMPAVICFVGVVDDFGTLMVVRRADFLSVFDEPQRDALAMLFLKLRDAQNTAAEVLWGAWLFPLAVLVYKSRLVPRFLGVWLAIGGAAYLALSVAGTLWRSFAAFGSLSRHPPDRIFDIADCAGIMMWTLQYNNGAKKGMKYAARQT